MAVLQQKRCFTSDPTSVLITRAKATSNLNRIIFLDKALDCLSDSRGHLGIRKGEPFLLEAFTRELMKTRQTEKLLPNIVKCELCRYMSRYCYLYLLAARIQYIQLHAQARSTVTHTCNKLVSRFSGWCLSGRRRKLPGLSSLILRRPFSFQFYLDCFFISLSSNFISVIIYSFTSRRCAPVLT
jgi:hypothetical protein